MSSLRPGDLIPTNPIGRLPWQSRLIQAILGALGSAGGSVNNFVARRHGERQSTDCVSDLVRIENTLGHYRRNSLTTRRFARKLTTPFYHARLATCPVRLYKQRAGHSSIPDGSITPRSILAPYDDTTS